MSEFRENAEPATVASTAGLTMLGADDAGVCADGVCSIPGPDGGGLRGARDADLPNLAV